MEDFINIVTTHRPLMMRTAMSILHNEMDSSDAVQDTLFCCWQHLDSLRDAQKIRAWLLRCLTNKCIDMIRKAERERLLIETLGKNLKSCAECDPLFLLEIREMLATISREGRACLYLRNWEGYTISEIAGFMNIPTSTVKSRLYQGRKKALGVG